MNSSSHPVSGADYDISDIGDLLDNLNILLHDIPLDSASLNLIGEFSLYCGGFQNLTLLLLHLLTNKSGLSFYEFREKSQ